MYELSYLLYKETTRTGHQRFYIVAISRLWWKNKIVREDVVVSEEFGSNVYAALKAFRHIAGSPEPVFPEHLHDICQDLAATMPRNPEGERC
ncbi:MAG: hypothetical protein ACPLPR_10065 [Bacillota bacterium]